MISQFILDDKEEPAIPDWHTDIVRDRIRVYDKNPELAFEFDEAIDEIENELKTLQKGNS